MKNLKKKLDVHCALMLARLQAGIDWYGEKFPDTKWRY